jgi:hypothetical protein
MPPIEHAPNSFYAITGSEEAKKLHERFLDGEFEQVIEVEDISGKAPQEFLLFQNAGDDAAKTFGVDGVSRVDKGARYDRSRPIAQRVLGKLIYG